MVNVVKSNFIQQSNDFLQHLPKAAFIAIDEEMTGINVPNSNTRPRKDLPPCDAWKQLKQAPERYHIIQLGVALFEPAGNFNSNSNKENSETDEYESEDEGEVYDWKVRRYNFYMFPSGEDAQQREVVLNPSAVAFLNQHKMSFDLWTQQGIPYQTESQAKQTIQKLVDEQLKLLYPPEPVAKPTVEGTVQRKIELKQAEDIDFFARTMAGLREWLDTAHNTSASLSSTPPPIDPKTGAPKEASYLLPSCNTFLRRALYERIQQEYPSLILENAGRDYRGQIRVWRLSDEEKRQRDEHLRREAWETCIVKQVGLWRIFHALSLACRGIPIPMASTLFAGSYSQVDWKSENHFGDYDVTQNFKVAPKPIVVHNGFMDLCFLLSHLVSDKLPNELTQCKQMILRYFPHVYDTKILATEFSKTYKNENSNLQNLYTKVVRETDNLDSRIEVAEQVESIVVGNSVTQEHEAAYDAFMTGSIFVGLCSDIFEHQLRRSHDEHVNVVKRLVQLWNDSNCIVQRTLYGKNLLHQMSLYTMDLESEEDPPSRGLKADSSYYVSGFDSSVATRDIIRCLSNLIDDEARRIRFDITWIDDTSFIAGVDVRELENESLLSATYLTEIERIQGAIILNALKKRFTKESITLLRDHLRDRQKPSPSSVVSSASTSLWMKLFNFFGFGSESGRKRGAGEDLSGRPTKRSKT